MAESAKLRGTDISDTFQGVLHAKGKPIPATGVETVYDGEGNSSALKIGRTKVEITGDLIVDGSVTFQDNGLDSDSVAEIVNKLYPVGAVYISTSEGNPGGASGPFSGTNWKQIAEGKFLIGAGVGTDSSGAQKTFAKGDDGNKANAGTYSHTLTQGQMPSHTHSVNTGGMAGGVVGPIQGGNHSEGGAAGSRRGGTALPTGGNQPHNNTPPWFGVFMWERTS